MWLLFTGIAIVVVRMWFVYLQKKEGINKARDWMSQAISIALTAALGVLVFAIKDFIENQHKKNAVLEEIKIVLNHAQEQTQKPSPLVTFLPDAYIKKAIDDVLYPVVMTRHLINLEINISEYNRWAQYADAHLLPSVSIPERNLRNYEALLSQATEKTLHQAQFVYDCLTTGTSPLDLNCI